MAVAADEWLRYVEHDRARKPSTVRGYRTSVEGIIKPTLGDVPIERVSTELVERWRGELLREGRSARTVNRLTTELHGIFARARKVWKLPANPVSDVEPLGEQRQAELDFYSPEEVWALVRAAEAGGVGREPSEQDAALFLTAAFAGLRLGELIALRVLDIDFPGEAIRVARNFVAGAFTTPKSGKVRAVPMVPEVAKALARLLDREHFTGPDDLVFPGTGGAPLDGSALRRRYKDAADRAKLRRLPFHDPRHIFASLVIDRANIVEVQEWCGHADISTTRRYLHYRRRGDEARRIADAFRVEIVASENEVAPLRA